MGLRGVCLGSWLSCWCGVVEPQRRPGCVVLAPLWPFGSGLGGSPKPCPCVRVAASEAAE